MGASEGYLKPDHITWKKIGEDRIIVLDLNSGKYFSLNETAAVIWQSIVSGKSTDGIMGEITRRFEVADTAPDEIRNIIDNFIANGLISISENAQIKVKGETELTQALSRKPYIKPGVQAHEPITQVTAGSSASYSGGGTHYWYPC